MKLILFLFSLGLICCNSHQKHNDGQFIEVVDNNPILDSLKWRYYVYNYSRPAIFNDTFPPYIDVKFMPIECDISFDGSNSKGKDSIYYRFSLVKHGYRFGWIEAGTADFLGVFNNNITPILTHGIVNYIKYPDSVKYYYKQSEKHFIQYLQNYKGDMGEWIRREAIKRKIISL